MHHDAVILKNNRHMECSKKYANEWQKEERTKYVACHLL